MASAARPAPSPEKRSFALASGRIDIAVAHADWPLDALCAFAARDNPKRAFLVVSKVLGRHIPVAPSVMRASFADLAAKIPGDLPGPVIVIGLAETAICLGQGVHEEYLRRTGRGDVLSLHSTRQQIGHPVLCRFDEPHSHASAHLVYRPIDAAFAAPRSLVIVDDEISTGTTIANLAHAIIGAMPSIETIVALSLADWSGGGDWIAALPRAAHVGSLISGRLTWTAADPAAPVAVNDFDRVAPRLGTMAAHRNFGRLGRADIASEGDPLRAKLDLAAYVPVRILGTGEFTYPAFRIAEALERERHDIVVQSTTRSPAPIDGAVWRGFRFADNYETGVANYLYNADPDDGRVTIICHETPPGSIDRTLIADYRAQTLYFGDSV